MSTETVAGFLLRRGGAVHVRSGADAHSMYFVEQPSIVAFGTALGGIGDIDHDGRGDFIVGGRNILVSSGGDGKAFVYSGATGTLLYTFDGDALDDSFGASVAGAGDVDMDGTPDVIVGAPFDSTHGPQSGRARVFSGADGSILFTSTYPSTRFGAASGQQGDVAATPADLIVGVRRRHEDSSGAVTVFSDPGRRQLRDRRRSPALFGRVARRWAMRTGTATAGSRCWRADDVTSSGRATPADLSGRAVDLLQPRRTARAACPRRVSGRLSVSGPDDFHVTAAGARPAAQDLLVARHGVDSIQAGRAASHHRSFARPPELGWNFRLQRGYDYAFTQASLAAHALEIRTKVHGQY
jgi:hypothetical protein